MNTTMSYTKICACCRRDLPLEAYSKNKNTYDGYMYYCKDCMNYKMQAVRIKKGLIPSKSKKRNPKLAEFTNHQLIKELENRMVLPRYAHLSNMTSNN